MAEFLVEVIANYTPQSRIVNLGNSQIVIKGAASSVAVMAHTDTTGFTLGYDRTLIPIGTPAAENADALRRAGHFDNSFKLESKTRQQWQLAGGEEVPHGSRLVYSANPVNDGFTVTAPYLDNRAGLWAALQLLLTCPNIAVAFTSGEEVSGIGARSCARYLSENLSINRVLISDITWDTDYVHVGQGPAVSLRDASVPNRQFVDEVVQLARSSGIRHQIEIESDGGSDGAHIDDGSYPIDWVFVGAPETNPHSSHETMSLDDLRSMAELLKYLVDNV